MFELLKLGVQVATLLYGVGVIDGLDREFAHALQHVRDLRRCTLSRLHERDRVAGISHGLVQAADLLRHAGGNGQARRVVFG